MHLSLSYKITDIGWAECILGDEDSTCTLTASYCSDALRSLVLAALVVESGFTSATFSFVEEPGEYRWVITSPRINEIELRVYEFSSSFSELPDGEGCLLFNTRCRPSVFARAVGAAASEVLAALGEQGYAEQWVQHPFPSNQLKELKRVLESEREA